MAGRGARDQGMRPRPRSATRRLPPRVLAIATLAAILALVASCTTAIEGKGALAENAAPTADPTGTSSPTSDPTSAPTTDPDLPSEPQPPYPTTNAEFEVYLIDEAPGGLQQVPNGQTFLGLPSGPVSLDDTAAQFGGMESEEAVEWLESLGYWQGYRRLWGTEQNFIYSIVDQFLVNDGSSEFVESFAPNYAERLGSTSEEIEDYPGCVVAAGEDSNSDGRPTSFASCSKKVWSIDIQAVADSPEAAKELAVQMAKTQYSKLP